MKEIITAIIFGITILSTYWAITGSVTLMIANIREEEDYFLKKKLIASIVMDILCTVSWMIFYYITH